MSWHSLNICPTSHIRPVPFSIQDNIIYCTNYRFNKENKCGIFEYNLKTDTHKMIEKWEAADTGMLSYFGNKSKTIHYTPYGNSLIYSRRSDKLIFVGGADVCNNYNLFTFIMIYKDRTMTKIACESEIGYNPRLALTNNDKYLHIIGGTKNDYHIIYNLSTNKYAPIHCFRNTNPKIESHALIYCPLTNSLFMFGGHSWTKKIYFDHFWKFDLNDIDNNSWINEKKKKMKQKMAGFGYVLFDNRIIITFGGFGSNNRKVDNIFYLDVLGNDSWKESTVKCPKPGHCNAVLVNYNTVHILPYYDYQDHYYINVADILPNNMSYFVKHNMKIDDVKCSECDSLHKIVEKIQIENKTLKDEFNKIKINETKLIEQNIMLKNKINSLNVEFKENRMEFGLLLNKYDQLKKSRKLDISKYVAWTADDMIEWILSLENERFKQYVTKLQNIFEEQDIDGSCFHDIHKSDLTEWGIRNFKDRSSLFNHIQNLLSQNDKHDHQNTQNDFIEGVNSTEYINR